MTDFGTRLHATDSLFGRMLADSRNASYEAASDPDGWVDEDYLDHLLVSDEELEAEILRSAEVVALFVEAGAL